MMDAQELSKPWWRWPAALAVAVLTALAFAAYLSPHMARDLAARLWSCF